MASHKEYLNFILDQLSGLDDIACRIHPVLPREDNRRDL